VIRWGARVHAGALCARILTEPLRARCPACPPVARSFRFVAVPEDTPGYNLYVKEPIDISTIEARLNAGQYASLVPLEAAFKLMYDNCDAYNDPMINQTGAQFLECSRASRKKAEKRFGKIRKKLLDAGKKADAAGGAAAPKPKLQLKLSMK
jgi:hypothetical protein